MYHDLASYECNWVLTKTLQMFPVLLHTCTFWAVSNPSMLCMEADSRLLTTLTDKSTTFIACGFGRTVIASQQPFMQKYTYMTIVMYV